MKLESANLRQQHSFSRDFQKSWNFNDLAVKNMFGYTAVFLFFWAAIAYVFSNLSLSFETGGGRYFFLLLSFLTGIAHVFIFPKWLPRFYYMKGFVYTVVLAAANFFLGTFIFNTYPFTGNLLLFAAGAAFVLPAAIALSWRYFISIPVKVNAPWQMPADMQPETRMSLLLNSLLFRVMIKVNEEDAAPSVFRVTLTGKLTIGEMFCRFLYDQKSSISITGKDGKPCQWRFFRKTLLSAKPLDPGKSITSNGINEGDTILVERVLH